MFQLLKNPDFDFMGRRNMWLTLSLVVVLGMAVVLGVRGLNLGIEFTGGNELQIRFKQSPDISQIRSSLADAGMTSQVVTTIGDPDENEIYIRLASQADGEEEAGDLAPRVMAALRADAGGGAAGGLPDLNVERQAAIEEILLDSPDLSGEQAAALAAVIAEQRKKQAIFGSFDDLAAIEGMTPEILDDLRQRTELGPLALRSQSYIGPAIGHELMQKAMFAIIGSLIGMLIYIWIRFQLQWGFAAVVALTHDTVITLGLFSLFAKEMSLPVVAAFLTLIGYSVNDTVVVFDRIRENLQNKKTDDLESVINLSINQTLSRTIITSGLTWVVVFGLFLFGGAALNPFSFVLSIGVVVGTYSSIYVASPFLVMWQRFVNSRRLGAGSGAGSKKVRQTTAG